METTAFDGTTAELFSNDVLAGESGAPAGGTKPKARIVAHVRTGSRRWIGAAAGGYHDGENTLVDELAGTLREGMLNLADRGFSMDRWIRFSATGAHLCWRVKNAVKSVPFKTSRPYPTSLSWSCSTSLTACWARAAAISPTGLRRACPTRSPGWSSSR
jgi:hypothetical protein